MIVVMGIAAHLTWIYWPDCWFTYFGHFETISRDTASDLFMGVAINVFYKLHSAFYNTIKTPFNEFITRLLIAMGQLFFKSSFQINLFHPFFM